MLIKDRKLKIYDPNEKEEFRIQLEFNEESNIQMNLVDLNGNKISAILEIIEGLGLILFKNIPEKAPFPLNSIGQIELI